MNTELARSWFLHTALKYEGRWYIWGGDDPDGFDCSGLAMICLQSAGVLLKNEDKTADDLWNLFADKIVARPGGGCLAFWFNSEGKAVHVAICLDSEFCMTADGGGSQVKTLGDAQKHNAFIRVLPINHRALIPRFINPFL